MYGTWSNGSTYLTKIIGTWFFKSNVDGAVTKATNRDAVTAICRDEHDVFQGASVVIFDGITDPETLEATTCNEALMLREDQHLEKL